jgi:exopolyphosphatase/guanosine-5'-triphosphate,3'-diphosphate pyrophosphatase
MKVPGLDASRADVIVAGVAILDGLMDHLQLEHLEVSRRGLRDGVMIDTLRRHGLWDAQDPDQALFDAAEALGRRCGFDFGHAAQVRKIALRLFDGLAPKIVPQGPRSPEAGAARRVIATAALLHDIGVFISYARHHKHSAYLIANAEIPGLTETEKALASNVARYHRRAHPRDRHPEFVALPGEQRTLVRKLAAIVRIADGLDRTHDSRVRGVALRARKDRIVVLVDSGKDLELELWAVRQKAALFREAFGTDLVFKAGGGKSSKKK